MRKSIVDVIKELEQRNKQLLEEIKTLKKQLMNKAKLWGKFSSILYYIMTVFLMKE